MSTQRYAPGRLFPPYAFLPGRNPHPVRDPRGHSFGVEEEPPGFFEPGLWRDNEDYLFGVDLYNHGFLWEAHEAWEGLWHCAKHDAAQADFLQGLIQCSAASLKVPMGQPRGVAKLAEQGTKRLSNVVALEGELYMGLEIEPFVEAFRAFADSEPESCEARPRLVLSD